MNLVAVTTPPAANYAPDIPLRLGIFPQNANGWLGAPDFTGCRADGSGFAPRVTCRTVRIDGQELQTEFLEVEDRRVTFDLADGVQGMEVILEVELTARGLLRTRAEVTHTGSDEYTLASLTPALPVPLDATELLDFAGRWIHERTPQPRAFTTGTHLRENRRGRTGADAAHLLCRCSTV